MLQLAYDSFADCGSLLHHVSLGFFDTGAWVGFMLVILGFIGAVGLGLNLIRAVASRYWPTSSTLILKSSLIEAGRNSRPTYIADVEYEFFVNQVRYTGSTIQFMRPEGGRSWALAALQKYPQGSTVEVRYNPANPRISALEAGCDSTAYYFSIIPVAMIVAGGLVIQRCWE
jgi:hypothetical protein